jgi:hypothetical protein
MRLQDKANQSFSFVTCSVSEASFARAQHPFWESQRDQVPIWEVIRKDRPPLLFDSRSLIWDW